MTFGDLNIYIIFFFLMLLSIIINVNTALHLLLTAEILWITLYLIVLSIGISYDNMNFLSLTFFFLVLSAVEFGVGLILMLLQNILMRSLNLSDNNTSWMKFSTRFNKNLKTINQPWI